VDCCRPISHLDDLASRSDEDKKLFPRTAAWLDMLANTEGVKKLKAKGVPILP